MKALLTEIQGCDLCADRFAATATAHAPRPVVWLGERPRIVIAGQAPGARVHRSGQPFTDPSGDRLRDWMGVDETVFYDKTRISILSMAFCFPGHDARGSDLPPPKICAATWRARVLEAMGPVPLTLLVGGFAQDWHLGKGPTLRQRVADWRSFAPGIFPLPHPSWRNNSYLKSNPWFTAELLPALQSRIQEVLA